MEVLAFLLHLVIFNNKKLTGDQSMMGASSNPPNPNTRNAVGGGG